MDENKFNFQKIKFNYSINEESFIEFRFERRTKYNNVYEIICVGKIDEHNTDNDLNNNIYVLELQLSKNYYNSVQLDSYSFNNNKLIIVTKTKQNDTNNECKHSTYCKNNTHTFNMEYYSKQEIETILEWFKEFKYLSDLNIEKNINWSINNTYNECTMAIDYPEKNLIFSTHNLANNVKQLLKFIVVHKTHVNSGTKLISYNIENNNLVICFEYYYKVSIKNIITISFDITNICQFKIEQMIIWLNEIASLSTNYYYIYYNRSDE
ncbi:MAG: hypothetical protein KIT69_05810 [Propionibacteriaceae bacterium]|nr:hypothetical protein [Propionibacteriaceae bacterium]